MMLTELKGATAPTVTPDTTKTPSTVNDSPAPSIGQALIAAATPSELLTRVSIHRQYLPDRPLPPPLQRAIATAWRRL